MKNRQVLWYQRQNAITLGHWLGIELERMEWVLISGLTNRVGGNASSETYRIYRGCLQDASRVVMRLGRCEKNREGPSELHAKWVGGLTRGLLSSVGAHLNVGTRNGTVCMAVWFFFHELVKEMDADSYPGIGQMSLRPKQGSVPSDNNQLVEETQLSLSTDG